FDEARAKQDGTPANEDEDAKLEHFVLDLGHTDVPIEVRCIRGNTGFAAADFVKSVEADLLVVPLDPEKNAGQLPPNLEWLMDVIPCNLWLFRWADQGSVLIVARTGYIAHSARSIGHSVR